MALTAGSPLGPYEIVALLATGGMGLAKDNQLGRWRRAEDLILPGADPIEAEFVPTYASVRSRSVGKNWGAMLRIMALIKPVDRRAVSPTCGPNAAVR